MQADWYFLIPKFLNFLLFVCVWFFFLFFRYFSLLDLDGCFQIQKKNEGP